MKITAKTEITVEATVTVFAYYWAGPEVRNAIEHQPFRLSVSAPLNQLHLRAAEQASHLVFGALFRHQPWHLSRTCGDFLVEAAGLAAFAAHVRAGEHEIALLGIGTDEKDLRVTQCITAGYASRVAFTNPRICSALGIATFGHGAIAQLDAQDAKQAVGA